MLLIKEPRIEKCYTTLAERVGGIDFHAGTLFEQEGYKYNVFREGHEIMMNPEGSYFERGGKALGIVPEGLQGRQNLVDWHDVSDYYGKKDKEPLIEAGLKQLYTTDDDKGCASYRWTARRAAWPAGGRRASARSAGRGTGTSG